MKAEQLELPFEEPVVAPVLPVTAFLVVVDEHGGRRPPALTTPLKVERQANLADIRAGLHGGGRRRCLPPAGGHRDDAAQPKAAHPGRVNPRQPRKQEVMKNTRRVGLYVALVCSCDAQLELDVPEDGEAAAWVTSAR